MILETPRLVLREMVVEDANDMFELNADTEVIQYTGNVAFKDVKEAQEFLRNYTHYIEYGFGRWAMIRKEDQAFIGWCGLKYIPEVDEIDIGYRLFKKYWNQAYATEAAKACLEYGFNVLKINTIVGRARAENKASIKVLEKIGLVFKAKYDIDGFPGVIYSLDKNNELE